MSSFSASPPQLTTVLSQFPPRISFHTVYTLKYSSPSTSSSKIVDQKSDSLCICKLRIYCTHEKCTWWHFSLLPSSVFPVKSSTTGVLLLQNGTLSSCKRCIFFSFKFSSHYTIIPQAIHPILYSLYYTLESHLMYYFLWNDQQQKAHVVVTLHWFFYPAATLIDDAFSKLLLFHHFFLSRKHIKKLQHHQKKSQVKETENGLWNQ